MPEEHINTGVDQGPDAGGQQEDFSLEEILFGGEDDQTGVDEQSDAGSEETAEQEGEAAEPQEDQQQQEPSEVSAGQGESGLPDEKSEKAFAKKWSAEKEKLNQEREQIREEERQRIMQEMQQRTQTTQKQQQQGAPKHREMSDEEIEKLADEWGVPTELVKVVHNQQKMLNQQIEENRKQAKMQRERKEFQDAQDYAQKLKQENPSLPDFDQDKLHQYRMEHYRKYRTHLPWSEAYRMYVADAVMSGDMTRQAQQETINQIQEREKASGSLKGSSQKKPPRIKEAPKDKFEQMVESVKSGKYKRS